MIRLVMTTMMGGDDNGGVMNQEEADQDVADEGSEEVDSRGEVIFKEWVGGRNIFTSARTYYYYNLKFYWR